MKDIVIVLKIILAITLIWIAIIFGFSTDTDSNQKTVRISNRIIVLTSKASSNTNVTKSKSSMSIQEKINMFNFFIRKASHFIEYCILAVLLYLNFYTRKIHLSLALPYILFMGLFTAVIDEYIQMFTKRTSSVKDVLIDFGGITLGLVISIVYKKIISMSRCEQKDAR